MAFAHGANVPISFGANGTIVVLIRIRDAEFANVAHNLRVLYEFSRSDLIGCFLQNINYMPVPSFDRHTEWCSIADVGYTRIAAELM